MYDDNFVFTSNPNYNRNGLSSEAGVAYPYPLPLIPHFPFSSTPTPQPFNAKIGLNGNLCDGAIDWNDPALYESLPSLSALLDDHSNFQDTVLPAPHNDMSDVSPDTGESLDNASVPGHDIQDTTPSQDKAANLPSQEEIPPISHTGTAEIAVDANNSS
jgi:hypothetical protein